MVSEVGDCGYSLRSRHVSVDNPNLHKSRSGKRRMNSNPKKNHIDKQRNDPVKERSLRYANKALCHLNSKENLDFELVKPGLIQACGISQGIVFHINFKAKLRGHPDDPVQTFFAQLRLMMEIRPYNMTLFVDCCVNLGPTHLLPKKAYLSGCQYCAATLIYHPVGGCEKLLLGCENDDDKWLYGDSNTDSKGSAGSQDDPDVQYEEVEVCGRMVRRRV